MYKKIFLAFLFFTCFHISAFASELSSSVNEILNSFDFDKDSVVSISIKDKKTGKTVYEKNPYKFLNPASTLKLFTMASSIDTLGKDYSFDTAFYKDKENNLYLKLSADPLFTSDDMNLLVQNLKTNHKGRINKIYIDDSIIDKVPYPDGWTIDDYWPNAPKISPYMVDFNTVKVDFYLNESKDNIRIIQKSPYKFSFVNKLTVSNSNNLDFVIDESHNTVDVVGSISSNIINKEIPVINPKYFYCQKLNQTLNKNGISYSNKFLFKQVPKDAYVVAKFSRPIDEVISHVLETSDNLAAEMVFKVAGGEYARLHSSVKEGFDSFGTTKNGINMFYEFCKKNNLPENQVKIRDASGVSRYNILNVNWMTNALLKLDFDYEKFLPTAGEGTLSKRMRELKDSVYLKTGTIYGTSSLAGLIKSKDNEYLYASVIMSYNRNKSLIKGVEDEIIYEVYRMDEDE